MVSFRWDWREQLSYIGPGLSLGLLLPNSIWGEVCSHAELWAVRFTHACTPHISLGRLSCPSWEKSNLEPFLVRISLVCWTPDSREVLLCSLEAADSAPRMQQRTQPWILSLLQHMDHFQVARDIWALVLELPWEGSVQARSDQAVLSHFCSRAEMHLCMTLGKSFLPSCP